MLGPLSLPSTQLMSTQKLGLYSNFKAGYEICVWDAVGMDEATSVACLMVSVTFPVEREAKVEKNIEILF